MKIDAFEAGRVVFVPATVRLVLTARSLAEVVKRGIATLSVFVVDLDRPNTMHIEPCEPMSRVHDAIYADENIAIYGVPASGFVANPHAI